MSRKRNKPKKQHHPEAPIEKMLADLRAAGKITKDSVYVAEYEDGDALERTIILNMRTMPMCWAIPFDEVVFSKWVKNILSHNRLMPWDDILTTGSTYLPTARNLLHSQFLEHTSLDWMIMLDSDVCPPPVFESRLLERVKANPEIKMIGGWYRKKAEPYGPCVYHDKGDLFPDGSIRVGQYREDEIGTGLAEVEAAGAGCWLMHRSVAEALGPKPYSMEDGGEDLRLCRAVRAAGFKLWLDWDIACAHVGVGLA